MSQQPTRLKDASGAHPLARELLRSAPRTSPMPAPSQARGARRVAQLALLPAIAAGVSLWSKAVAAAFGLGFTSAIALVAVVPDVRNALSDPKRAPASHALRSPRAAPAHVLRQAPEERATDAGALPHALDAGAQGPAAGSGTVNPGTPRRAPISAPARAAERAEAVMTPPAEVAPPLALEQLAPPQPVESRHERAREAPAANAPLAAEVRLLARARALAHTHPARALTLLQRHAHDFPTGSLSLEREVLVIESLHRSGERAQAAERARRLLARAPGALYAARLRALLGSAP